MLNTQAYCKSTFQNKQEKQFHCLEEIKWYVIPISLQLFYFLIYFIDYTITVVWFSPLPYITPYNHIPLL